MVAKLHFLLCYFNTHSRHHPYHRAQHGPGLLRHDHHFRTERGPPGPDLGGGCDPGGVRPGPFPGLVGRQLLAGHRHAAIHDIRLPGEE